MTTKIPAPQMPETVCPRVERRARRFWVSMIVGLLGLQITIAVVSVMVAVSDPSVAVAPDYYRQALNWDVTRRARLRAQQLGWKFDYVVLPRAGEEPYREMRLVIRTADGKPVSGLRVAGKVFHHARGNEIHELQLEEIAEGVYTCHVPILRGGQWQVDMQMEGMAGLAADNRTIVVQ